MQPVWLRVGISPNVGSDLPAPQRSCCSLMQPVWLRVGISPNVGSACSLFPTRCASLRVRLILAQRQRGPAGAGAPACGALGRRAGRLAAEGRTGWAEARAGLAVREREGEEKERSGDGAD